MDVRSFVYGIVNVFPSPLRTPVRRVADAVFGVWDELSGVFRIAVPSWGRIWSGVNGFVWQVAQGFINAYRTAYWVAFDWLPRWVRTEVDRATTWARGVIDALAETVQRGLSYVSSLARRWVDEALDTLNRLRSWAAEQLRRVVDTLNAVVRIVSTLLTNPRALAAWLVAAMVDALFAWFLSNVDSIVDALWAHRHAALLRSAERIEHTLARLL